MRISSRKILKTNFNIFGGFKNLKFMILFKRILTYDAQYSFQTL